MKLKWSGEIKDLDLKFSCESSLYTILSLVNIAGGSGEESGPGSDIRDCMGMGGPGGGLRLNQNLDFEFEFPDLQY